MKVKKPQLDENNIRSNKVKEMKLKKPQLDENNIRSNKAKEMKANSEPKKISTFLTNKNIHQFDKLERNENESISLFSNNDENNIDNSASHSSLDHLQKKIKSMPSIEPSSTHKNIDELTYICELSKSQPQPTLDAFEDIKIVSSHRKCLDCGDRINSNEPYWKKRCTDCYFRFKSTQQH